MPDSRPAADGVAPGHFPGPPVATGHVAACPRRVRARDETGWLLDTVAAFYVWEHPYYPQYAVPGAGLPAALGEVARAAPADPRLVGYVVLPLEQGMSWFEEDEPVRGHPRNPYVRVDALRSGRSVTVSLPDDTGGSGQVVARTTSPVAVFETSLPPRWYVDRTCVDQRLLTLSGTTTLCPYKGETSAYWSIGDLTDVAWSYAAPNPGLGAIAGLVSFDDTRLLVRVDPR